MRRHIAKLLGLMAASSVLVLWLAAAPMASGGGPCHDGSAKPASTTEATTQIKLMPCAFAPTVTQVATGSSVTFFNGPEYTHLITGANQAWGSPDTEVQPGREVTYTFAKAGIYPYACAIHSGMSGVIVVGDVASTGAGGTAAGTTTTGSAAGSGQTTPPSTSPIESVALVVGSALAGAVVGASVIWMSTRRRASAEEKAAGMA
jgi:plastocyanin